MAPFCDCVVLVVPPNTYTHARTRTCAPTHSHAAGVECGGGGRGRRNVARKLPATARPGARRAAICCAINGTDPAVSGGRAAAPGVLLIDGLAGGYVYAKVATLDVMPPGGLGASMDCAHRRRECATCLPEQTARQLEGPHS